MSSRHALTTHHTVTATAACVIKCHPIDSLHAWWCEQAGYNEPSIVNGILFQVRSCYSCCATDALCMANS
jgi:hypothetical protein